MMPVATEKEARRRILVITCNLPSHLYAKLATVLNAAGHQVTPAAPQGPAYERIKSETSNVLNIRCITVGGESTTTKHI